MSAWLIAVFMVACVVVPLTIIQRNERKREIRSHLGDTIHDPSRKEPIEDS